MDERECGRERERERETETGKSSALSGMSYTFVPLVPVITGFRVNYTHIAFLFLVMWDI